MSLLTGYAVYHLNLAFSSVEEETRGEIVKKCYWPLLQMASDLQIKLGIEATGFTLREIARLDPLWVDVFKHRLAKGEVELIGSGFTQTIGPLVPAHVVEANLELGQMEYERLVGFRPSLALVNEQAWSAGLVGAYKRAGFDGIIMDWDACFANNPTWDKEWRFAPQRASDGAGDAIDVLWTHTFAFQKMQRLAHDDMSLEDYRTYLKSRIGDAPRAFPIYSNDAEVFDFRPGRFTTEAATSEGSEWTRVREGFEAFLAMDETAFAAPSEIMELAKGWGEPHELRLDSPEHPIPVKKQHKYNVSRWAVSGRDDLAANTACWKLYERLKSAAPEGLTNETADKWRELCALWSSDFRTHITEKRWTKFQDALTHADQTFPRGLEAVAPPAPRAGRIPNAEIKQDDRFLTIETENTRVILNTRKGLAVEALWLGDLEGPAPFKTLPHGYFDDIGYAADWFSGTTILDRAGAPKVTDLARVTPTVEARDDAVLVSATINTSLGPLTKTLEVGRAAPLLKWRLTIDWTEWPRGSLRLGNFTLNPEAFEAGSLAYRAHNGGRTATAYPLAGHDVDHGAPVSFMVSASAGVGLTEGHMEIGDASRRYRIEVDMTKAALLGLVTHKTVDGLPFARVALSALEMDETRKAAGGGSGKREFEFALAC